MSFFSSQTDSEAQHRRMLQTPIPRLVVRMSLPTVASQLITVVYNTVDTYFVSHINTSASAAVGIVFSLMSIIQALGFGFGMGANSLISRKLGEKCDEDACRYGNSALFAAAVVGVLLLAGGLLFLKGLMRILGSTPTILPYACDYARYILIGAPVMCCSFVLNNVLRAEGDPALSMRGLCVGGVLNIGLDPLLIFTFHMGIGGAALATILSQTVSFLILLSAFLRNKTIIKLSPRWISRKATDYGEICKFGLPTIFRQGLGSLSTALLNISAGLYGDAAIAAITISNKVYMLIRNIVLGVGQGFQPVAGYNFGAGDRKRVKKAFLFTCGLGTVFCCCAAAAIFFTAGPIIGWFRADTEVIRIGTIALYYGCAVMPFMAYSTYVNQLAQSLGFSMQATFLASCQQGIFFIPLVLVLPRLVGLAGIQVVQPAADFLTFLISIPFQLSFFRKVLNR